MFRQFCFFLFVGLISFGTNAQSDNTTLRREYAHLDSICYAKKNDTPALVIDHTRRMLDIGRQLQEDTLIVQAIMLQAEVLNFMGLFEASLKTSYEGLALAERINHCQFQINLGLLIGRAHQVMHHPEKSQEVLQKAKKVAIACPPYTDTIDLNYDIAFNLAVMGDVDGGIRLIEQNVEAAKRANLIDYMGLGMDHLANLWAEKGDYKKALDYELQLLRTPGALDDDITKTQVYEHLAEVYVVLKDWDNAQKYQREALKYATLTHMNDWIHECYKLQAIIDEARGDYKSALKNQRAYQHLKDSVYRAGYETNMAAMTALYDLESKQKTISLLEKDQQLNEGKIQQQRTLLLLALLLIIAVVVVIRFLNQRKTARLQEAFSRELLKAQEEERQHLSRELHDSVGQNILFVKNRLQRLAPAPDGQLVNSIDQALEEVRTIAKNLYPNQLEAYGLASAIDALCSLAQESSGVFISSDLQGIDDKLNREAKINCYRIVQECLNNALKHAEATAIRVTSNIQPDKVELVVQDNGKGLDKTSLERKSVRGFGLINMEERVKMLRGKFEMETAANKGVKLVFSIPVSMS